MLQLMFLRGEIPKDWKTYLVLPILKHGSPEGNISSYRLISINSCVGKIYENFIRCRLEWVVEHNRIIPWFSTGFRKSMGIVDNISYLVSRIQLALSRNFYALTVFLDLKSAYDHVNIYKLYGILSAMLISHYPMQFLIY